MVTSDATPAKSSGGWRRRGRWAPLAAVGVPVVLKLFVIDLYTVPQGGMRPGIAPGERFLGRKHPYRDAAQVRRGDVIVFTRRLADGKSYQFVWRVIGLPGDHVDAAGDEVRVNGTPLPRERLRVDGGLAIFREHNGGASYEIALPQAPGAKAPPDASLTVPPGEFFVLGDNRRDAADSRYDGTVPFETIVARRLR